MRPIRYFLAALLVLAPGVRAGTPWEDPDTGYRATIPDGWRQHHDKAKQTLVLAGPGGVRVRVETRVANQAVDKGEVSAWYRSDGRKLQAASSGLKVTQKPELLEGSLFGGRKTWSYGLAYKNREGIFHSLAWLASAPGKATGSHLQIRVMAYGQGARLDAQLETIQGFLASFAWPKQAAPDPTASEPADSGNVTVAVAPPSTPSKDPLERENSPEREAALDKILSGKAFDNGSLRGSVGVMASGAAIKDPKRLRAFGAASRIQGHTRTAEERDQAAGYLGFGKPK